ncbi:MAG: putative rane protein [Acidobacteriota bacterium]|jgi:putative membrane protein|nr:putative rane protein [Acidobacteriota bacterium]
MHTAGNILVAVVALLHLYFMVMEMFLWTKPAGRRAFGLTPEFAQASRALAANQGLYNGFLAAGLIWSLLVEHHMGFHLQLFFLTCVIVAGIYGAITVNRKILWIQAAPALLALVLIHFPH